jgi:post-segregation antitoxin (ccd killing protein)
MVRYTIIYVKVTAGTREKARRLGINISDVLRKTLEDEVKRREKEEINEVRTP